MIKLLDLVSPGALRWGFVVSIAAGLVYAGHRIDKHNAVVKAEERGRAAVQALWNAEKLALQAKALQEAEKARAEELRRVDAQREITDETARLAARHRAELLAAADAGQRLRQHYAQLLAAAADRDRAGQDPAAAFDGTAAGQVAGMCTELLGRAEARLRSLAAEADASRLAGSACEASYDALSASHRHGTGLTLHSPVDGSQSP